MTNNELKQVLQAALKSEYGFAPSKKDIKIFKSNVDAYHVFCIFEVNGIPYKFSSTYKLGKRNGLYVGEGTITKKKDI